MANFGFGQLDDKIFGLDAKKVDEMLAKPSQQEKVMNFLSPSAPPQMSGIDLSKMPDFTEADEESKKLYDQSSKLISDAMGKMDEEGKSALSPQEQASLAKGVTDEGYAKAYEALNKSTQMLDMIQASQLKSGELEKRFQELPEKYKILSRQDVMNGFSAGQKIGMAVAAGLGAFGSSITHAPNFAQQIIDENINSEVQASKEQYIQHLDSLQREGDLNITKLNAGLKMFEAKNQMLQNSLSAASRLSQIAVERASLRNTQMRAFEMKSNLQMNNAKIDFMNQNANYQAKEAGRQAKLAMLNNPMYRQYQDDNGNVHYVKFFSEDEAKNFSMIQNQNNDAIVALQQAKKEINNYRIHDARLILENFDQVHGTKLAEKLSPSLFGAGKGITDPIKNDEYKKELDASVMQYKNNITNYANAFKDSSGFTNTFTQLRESLSGIKSSPKP